ncbi:MAG: hypothetical protein IT395_05735, partial [Candidatus Omnitrophica bacterium]|nr:hypothetical protein [Candidatus Omnitrophota bacterium]
KNKLTVLQKNVLQALYVFVQANSVFDLAGQVFDDASVGNFRNFVVTNPQYQGRRTIICQTITELNLAFLVYELGFAVDAVTAVEVPVNFQGTDMNKTGGHSANLITFANGEKTLFDIVQGSDRNFGIGIAHRTIVVKGANGGEQIELYQRNMSQVLQGARGSTVQEFETYQSFENDFRGQYKALMTQQGTMADFIIDNKFSEALEVARQMKTQIDRLKASPELREYILQTLKKSIDDLDEIISSNILRLESKINAPAPSAQPASASAPVEQNVGGIDLNPVNLNLQVKRDGNGVPLPLINQSVREMNIEGFYPVIINITPVNNLPMLLGSNK